MSYSQIQKYLGFLIGQGFIDKIKVGNPSVTYKVTDNGLRLMEMINNVLEMLGLDEDEDIF